MLIQGEIKSGTYFDSVTLMIAGRDLTASHGVLDAAVIMGTSENKALLKSAGLWLEEFEAATDADLLVAVRAKNTEAAAAALLECNKRLKKTGAYAADRGELLPASLDGALEALPGANLALISVAGRHAAHEAMQALKAGLHVMLFSDNVAVEAEIELKLLARDKGLLVMGPDCGTAIINGVPLGFANVVRRGHIGIVAAAGTGAQEVSSILSNEGAGVSQVIGTGGRDVKAKVGGIMFLEALRALGDDPATHVIVLVSKPPDDCVLDHIGAALQDINKPVIAAIVGVPASIVERYGMVAAATLEEASLFAAAISNGLSVESVRKKLEAREQESVTLAQREAAHLSGSPKYIRGLFCGGTFCAEAQVILQRSKIRGLHSNVPMAITAPLKDAWRSRQHTLIDFGEDAFTIGRPHPMIDYSLRNRRIQGEARDPECAMILLDVVLGYGSNMDPVRELAGPICEARRFAAEAGRYLIVACSTTGTAEDPQDRTRVENGLRQAGALVFPSNAAASQFAAHVVRRIEAR